MKVIVLLSTYNGEQYLSEQLDSLIAQELLPSKIYVRDDGSSDATLDILKQYSEKYPFIEYYCGENRKPAGSFWNLIETCEEADYYALCDQDDVWFPDKLSTAVRTLEQEDPDMPLLYCSRFTLTDGDLNPINSDVSKLYGFSDFPHSLIYHTAPGCTFVFNHAARKKVLLYDITKEYCIIHDAIIHKVTAMFGKVILDETSHMYYRQHGNNEIGLSADRIKVFFGRIDRFLHSNIRNYRSKTAKSLLRVYGDQIDEDSRDLLNMVANYQEDAKLKRRLLNEKRFRSGTINDLFFRLLVLVNYI